VDVCLGVGCNRKRDVLAGSVISGCSREKQVCEQVIALVCMWELTAKVDAMGTLEMLMREVRTFKECMTRW
jgi:hypothetical protein